MGMAAALSVRVGPHVLTRSRLQGCRLRLHLGENEKENHVSSLVLPRPRRGPPAVGLDVDVGGPGPSCQKQNTSLNCVIQSKNYSYNIDESETLHKFIDFPISGL